MYVVGLTGGIGSGKSTLGKWFEEKGIPVYEADLEAKNLMNQDGELKKQLIDLLGEQTYQNNQYNRTYVSSLVFNNKELLEKLNALVHPAVFNHFHRWIENQNAPFIVKEAAILFESGSYRDCDWIVSVVADEKKRIERVMKRSGLSEAQILERMNNQWTDAQRIEKSDFVIENNANLKALKIQFNQLYKELLKQVESR